MMEIVHHIAGSKLTIRKAEPENLPACAAIANDWVDEMDWHPRHISREEFADLFRPENLTNRTMWVAERSGRIVGYMSLSDDAFVRALFFAPEGRGKGIGVMFLDLAKEQFPDGLELEVHEPNRGAQRFYRREGFVEMPERRKSAEETDEGIATLRMRWDGNAGDNS